MKLSIYTQTLTVLLKFRNGSVISYYSLMGIWLLIHAEIKFNPCQWKGPRGVLGQNMYCKGWVQMWIKSLTYGLELTYWYLSNTASILKDWNFTVMCCWGSNLQCITISTGNGMTLNRQQSMPLTNDDSYTISAVQLIYSDWKSDTSWCRSA